MKRRLTSISKLLIMTGCVSLLASVSSVNAAPLVYDVAPGYNSSYNQPVVRTDYTLPNKIRLEGDIRFNDAGQKINLSLRNTDVQQVLRMFADKAGLNIIFHGSVSGSVTLDLVDVSLEDAFKMVMKMTNLTYVIKDNTLMVVSTNEAESINLTKDNINILPVKYSDAAYLAQFLNSNVFSLNAPGLSYGPIVTTNAERNELLIFGTDADYQMAKKIVDKFDKKPMMTTYRVNHTTPIEMAKMICETLFQVNDASSGGGSSLSSEFSLNDGTMNDDDGKKLGGGSIICTVKSGVQTGNISSYSAKPAISVYAQPELGTLTLIGGTEQQVQMVNDFILDNDRKQPQALLEIQIISLSEEGSKTFSNEWVLGTKHMAIAFNGSGLNNTELTYTEKEDKEGNVTKTYNETPINYKGGITYPSQLTQKIIYLIENKKARLLSNPKVVLTNGKTSTIDLTQDYIQSVTMQVVNAGYQNNSTVQRSYNIGNDNGIKVEITPFISPDGYVSMNIKPEYAGPLADVTNTWGTETYVAATLLQRRNLDLKNVRVKDGETLVLGGLIYEDQSVTTKKVPILGDLPVIGFFFRSTRKSNTKNELVFMITPHIIKDTEDVAEL